MYFRGVPFRKKEQFVVRIKGIMNIKHINAFFNNSQDFSTFFNENDKGTWQADLCGIAKMKLSDFGLRKITGGDYCTFLEADNFFSYRRDGLCGRMAAFVFLKK